MGTKLVRDKNEEWCRTHGVSGQWHVSPDPAGAIRRKLFEELGEFAAAWDTGELYDLLDVIRAAIRVAPVGTAHHPEGIRELPEFAMDLFGIVVTELGRYAAHGDASALRAMQRAVVALTSLRDPEGRHAAAHRTKVAEMGEFRQLIEWSPVPEDGGAWG